MHPSVESFIREKQYVANVSPRTIELYRRCLVNLPEPAETTPASLKELVIRLRERGLSPAGARHRHSDMQYLPSLAERL